MARRSLSPDREMGVMDHLAELRSRVVRVAVLIAVATAIVWFYFDPIYRFFTAPIEPYLAHNNGKIVVTNWLEPFFIHLKLSLYGGIVVSAPFWIMELWGFLAPALTPQERKPVRLLAPLTVVLFGMGVLLAHLILPMTFQWALSYMPPNTELFQHVNDYVELLAKLYIAFGVAFELPVVLLFLARLGIINAGLMRQFWRHAVVGIMVVAAVITPSNDPITMTMCAVPMAGLYMMSIYLVEWMDRAIDGPAPSPTDDEDAPAES
jgi:sec-independent protein translocase protein TatC